MSIFFLGDIPMTNEISSRYPTISLIIRGSLRIAVVAAVFIFAASPAAGQSANDGFNPTTAAINVNAFAIRADGKIYVGGGFNTLGGLSRKSIALLNGDGSGDPTFAPIGVESGGFVGQLYAVAIQADGKIVIAGTFDKVNGVARSNIARLDQFGNLDATYAPVVDSTIFALDVQSDQKIVIGGAFTSVNSTGRNRLARLETNGTLDAGFDPAPNATVRAIKFDAAINRVYVAGDFSVIGGVTQKAVVRLFPSGAADTSFAPTSPGLGSALAIQPDGKVIIGHSSGVFRVNRSGLTDPAFSYSTSSWVSTIAIQSDGKAVIGGFITAIGAVPRNKVARFNANGTLDLDFDPNVTGSRLDALAVQPDGKILIGGAFTAIGSTSRLGIGRVYQDGTPDANATAGTASVDGPVAVIVPLPRLDQTMIGGNFANFDGTPMAEIARVNSAGKRDPAFTAPTFAGGWVNCITLDIAERYLVGGEFTTVNGNGSRKYLTRIGSIGNVDTSFNVDLNGPVYAAVVQQDTKIIIAGSFTTVNGTARNRIARINVDGTLDSTFNPNLDFWAYRLVYLQNGQILVGGEFTTVGGVARVGLARLNNNGTLDTTFDAALAGIVPTVNEMLLQPDGKILISGGFTSVSGTGRSYIARLNSTGSLDATFTTTLDSVALSMAVQADGKIMLGGRFSGINSVARAYLGRVNADGSLDTSFTANANDVVLAMAQQSDGKILAGGYFTTVAGQSRNRFARLSIPTPAVETVTATPTLVKWTQAGSAPAFTRVDFYTAPDTQLWQFVGAGVRDVVTGSWSLSGIDTTGGYLMARGYHRDFSSRRGVVEVIKSVPTIQALFKTPFDFDGDGKTDLSIFRPGPGEWWISKSSNGGNFATQFGTSTDKPVAVDFTGDGKTDVAYWRPSTGYWFVLRSEDSTYYSFPFGANGDIPVPADYDGDGKSDAAVFRPLAATWYISKSSGGTTIQGFGVATDLPVPGDYDGDGKADIGIYRPTGANGAEWWILKSAGGTFVTQFGAATDKAVPGDYTGDGKTDVAVWHPATGLWSVLRSEDLTYYAFPFGSNGDSPVPGDYDGDGRTDAGVFRPTNSTWYVQRSTAGVLIQQYGQAGDLPIPNSFVR